MKSDILDPFAIRLSMNLTVDSEEHFVDQIHL